MNTSTHIVLTRRERQIMDILYRRGRATAADVMKDLSGDPHYSTVRTQLRVLEEKGHLRHNEEGLRYVYVPLVPRHAARKSALKHLVHTFFDGSSEQVVAALLGGDATRLSEDDLASIAELVAKARKGARDDQGLRHRSDRARSRGTAAKAIRCAPTLGARLGDRLRGGDASAPSDRAGVADPDDGVLAKLSE
jgi:predicted transcriptional regulator